MVKNNGRGGRGNWYRIIVGMMMVLDTSKGGMVKHNGRGGDTYFRTYRIEKNRCIVFTVYSHLSTTATV